MLRFLRGANPRTKTIWWVLIIVTVVTFLGGFVFLLGSGLDSSNRARMSGAVGTVDGKSIHRSEFQQAVNEQREVWRRENGSDPGSRNLKGLELQAWRTLVIQHILGERAKELGLAVHDHEVVVSLRTNPPQSIVTSPAFQTDGKFDYEKYQSVLHDPNNVREVAALEEMARRTLPMRKLQERLLGSIKVTDLELKDEFHQRFDRINATLVMVFPAEGGQPPVPSEADIQRLYGRYKTRFSFGRRTQAEVLRVPKDFGEEEVRAARELANSLASRARAGEDFAGLARDYSEGPDAERGGEIGRVLAPTDFGAELSPRIAALDTGNVTDPIADGGTFRIFKLLSKELHPNGGPGVRLAQIVVEIKSNQERLRAQYEDLVKLRNQASRIGLGKAAAAKGLPTATTNYFDAENTPPELFAAPDAADWAIGAKERAVSSVYEGNDEFVIAQVLAQREAGVARREDIAEALRQLAEFDARVEQNKPKADAVARALAAGGSLEQAAAAAGLTADRIENMTRMQPDQRLAGAPEVVGALFAARPGQVIGPIRLPNAWYFARLDDKVPADETMFQQIREQLSAEILRRRQQTFFNAYVGQARADAKVKDLRQEVGL